MLGIENIATHIPAGRLSFAEKAVPWKLTAEFLSEKIGVQEVSRKDSSERASDLALAAFKNLQRKQAVDISSIELIALVTQNPDQKVPHVSAMLHGKLQSSPSCAAFDISQGCAGYVYGLSIALSFMRANGFRRGLLFTADPYSEIVDPEDRNTALLFGDGASVTLLSDRPRWTCGKFRFWTEGSRNQSLIVRDGKLVMDGADVFNFAATQVPSEIEKTLALNGYAKSEIDAFLIHSGSKYIVDTIIRRAGLSPEKTPFGIENFGNTVSSSIPLLMERELFSLREGASREKSAALLSGFGVGLSIASTVLERVQNS